ncbi:MAG: S41 family peptidase [Ferruginibacter sp.]
MKNLLLFLSVVFLSGCFSTPKKEDIEFKKFDTNALKEDLKILKGIITDMHAGAYTYNTPNQLNHIFDSVSLSITHSLNTREFYGKIDYIIDRIRCLHTLANLPDNYYDSISKRAVFFPFPLITINNRLYVNTDIQKIPLGTEILSVNSIKAKDIIKTVENFYHTDGFSEPAKKNAVDEEFAYDYFLAYGGSQEFTIEFMKDSAKAPDTKIYYGEKLNDIYKTNTAFFYYSTDVPYDLEIEDKTQTATITIRTFTYETDNAMNAYNNFLHNSFRLIKKSGIKNLIIDCRNNNGGYYDAAYNLLSYLVNKTLPQFDSSMQRFKQLTYTRYIADDDTDKIAREDTAWFRYTKINDHLYKLNDDEISRWEPKADLFKGRVFVIVNGHVLSSASLFTSVLRDKTSAVIIGEETGGSSDIHNSSVISFVLPNSKIKVDIPLRRYYQPVNKKQKGRGVIPDKMIPFTIADLKDNIDGPKSYILDSILVK